VEDAAAAADCSEATVIGEIDGETFTNGYKKIGSGKHV